MTCTYHATGATQTFTPPTGVTSITVKLVGAAGGSGAAVFSQFSGGSGGQGATVTGSIEHITGQSLTVYVGTQGEAGRFVNVFNGDRAVHASGGFGYGTGGTGGARADNIFAGGGGGGASAIVGSDGALAVAAGGGGSNLVPTGGTVTDSGGVGDGEVTISYTLGPVEQLAALAQAVQGVGPGKSLPNKVAAAQAYLTSNDTTDACTTMTGFVNEVRAQSGKHIPADTATTLAAKAGQILTALGC